LGRTDEPGRGMAPGSGRTIDMKRLPRPLQALFGTPLAAAVVVVAALATPAQAETVLRVVPHADLKNIDPIWTTAYITRNHGYMVYDTLFALDEALEVRPQMVESWSVSDDRLTWRFTLREGLLWHDGAPVTAADSVASIKRWGARDGMGQKLMDATAELRVVDERTFELELAEPYGLVLESLGKISSNVPFMMPERLAKTDPFAQVPEIIGSGPFRFVKEEWVPGSKVVYVRNDDYVPRDEPPSYAAGGKVAKVDRVEWNYIPDPATAMNALIAGEIDYFELPPHDLLPIMEAAPGVVVENLDPLGNQGWVRLNHTLAPFDKPKMRQAVLWMISQGDYLQAVIGNPAYYSTCPAYFGCGTPLESDIGSEPLMTQDLDKARALVREAGYDGTRVVILQATDIPINNGVALITAQLLREIGVKVELQAMDWSTLTSRRAISDPVDQGGWNLFITWWIGADILNPVNNIGVSGGCRERAWFGWPCDAEIERLRDAFARTTDLAEQKRLADAVQARAFEIVPYANFGQWFNPIAYRDNLEGMIKSPVPFFWNIEKK
jgi:peptide/nickel transport system substrate-binding protein